VSSQADLVRAALQAGKPVAFLNDSEDDTIAHLFNQRRDLRFFALASGRAAAFTIGKYLLESGHKEIAYVSLFNKTIWSQKRYQGLADAFAAAGRAEAVHAFTNDEYLSFLEPMRHRPQELADKWKQHMAPVTGTIDLLRGTKPFGAYSARIVRNLEKGVSESSVYLDLARTLEPLLDAALANLHISAWVCANDVIAAVAREYLVEKRIPVPQRISLVGFDDDIDQSFPLNLASFNFNMPAGVSRMIWFVLRPEEHMPPVEGYLVRRASVA
jgi:DNA-binding LacI/PurR family transcriptional regulator